MERKKMFSRKLIGSFIVGLIISSASLIKAQNKSIEQMMSNNASGFYTLREYCLVLHWVPF
jgi:hypothetical protein